MTRRRRARGIRRYIRKEKSRLRRQYIQQPDRARTDIESLLRRLQS